MKPLKLTVDKLPAVVYGKNYRESVGFEKWKVIRTKVYEKNNYTCSICGAIAPECDLHAHEVWTPDFKTHELVLTDIIPLCSWCHGLKHYARLLKVIEETGKDDFYMWVWWWTMINGYKESCPSVESKAGIAFIKHVDSQIVKWNKIDKIEWSYNFKNFSEARPCTV